MKYLLHLDGKMPNLALMKLATYWRACGEEVRLITGPQRFSGRGLFDPPGEVFGSSIFEFSAPLREKADEAWGPITWGGTGVRVESNLSDVHDLDWETVQPDYSLYPDVEYSIGFTQRGCRLRCGFCVVPKKEGAARSVSTIQQIWRGPGYPKQIHLLDNDFFGQPREEWLARISEIRTGGFRVCFSQGINIRLIDDGAAEALASIKIRDSKFQERRIYTAWDNLRDEEIFDRGISALTRAGIKGRQIMVYMLIGYRKGETMEEILHRFDHLVQLGCLPYPMVFDRKARHDLVKFQQWALNRWYLTVPWAKWDGNSHKMADT